MFGRLAKSVASIVMLAATSVAPAQAKQASVLDVPACPVQYGVHQGWMVCDTHYADYLYTDGRVEIFVIGLDLAVWHIWQNYYGDTQWSGWASLGGRIKYPAMGAGVYRLSNSPVNEPILRVLGVDSKWWCNQFDPRRVRWSDWYPDPTGVGGC